MADDVGHLMALFRYIWRGAGGSLRCGRRVPSVGRRLLQPPGVLFADGTDRHFHAVVTNRKLDGGLLLDWHREKAGTVGHVHDEVKNWLGGGHLPSQRFAVNAAWFKLALLTYHW